MIFKRFFSWWLAFSVFYCATFVQVHEIEHIPELLTPSHFVSFSDAKLDKSPIEQAVDQCEICIHGSALDHIVLFNYEFSIRDIFRTRSQIRSGINSAFNHLIWSSVLPRAPPAFLIS